MNDRSDGVAQYHSPSGVSHHLPNPIPHVWIVAMDRTVLASWFAVSEPTMLKPIRSVILELRALRAQLASAGIVLIATVNAYHGFHHAFLSRVHSQEQALTSAYSSCPFASPPSPVSL